MRSGARSPGARNGLPQNYYVPAPPVIDKARAERIRRTAAAGQAVRAARKARGLSQEALARQAGVSTGRVSELERGNHLPPPEILAALAEALGLSVTGLVPPPGGAGTAGSPVPGPAGPPRDTLRTPVSGAVREGPSLPLSPPAAAGTGTPQHPHPAALGGQPGAGLDAGAAAGTGETPLAVPASTPRTWTVALPPGLKTLSPNQRLFWAEERSRARELKKAARAMALKQKIPHLDRARITVVYHPPDRRRRDNDNIPAKSGKHCIDGIVAARVLADDSPEYIDGPHYSIGEIVKGGQLVLHITEVTGGAQ